MPPAVPPATPTAHAHAHAPLRRPHQGRMVAGVAAGLADHLDVDVAVVRVALVATVLLGALGVPLYLAAWLFIPDECEDESAAERILGYGCPGQDRWGWAGGAPAPGPAPPTGPAGPSWPARP
ncbi:MAG: PspC domain-containing protein, partial [Acidimicrobiales bacterium]